jgi:hypothetical protein
MPYSYEELHDLLLRKGPDHFRYIERHDDGRVSVYEGNNLRAFLAGNDSKAHSHRVEDRDGNLLYARDRNGKVTVGSKTQIDRYYRNRWGARVAMKDEVKVAAPVALQMLRESWDRALRWNGLRR